MIDQQILRNAVKDKIANMCVHAIVNECFIPALPFDKDDLTPDDRRALTLYSKGVLESVITEDGKRGAIPLLERAIETASDPRKRQFLTSIYTICAETAETVADRIAKNPTAGVSLEELLDNAGLNKEEIKDFNENISSLNPDKISEKIQDKVIDTIKSEQKAHHDAEEMNDRLKEMLTPEPEKNEDDDDDEFDEDDNMLDDDIAEDAATDKKSTEGEEGEEGSEEDIEDDEEAPEGNEDENDDDSKEEGDGEDEEPSDDSKDGEDGDNTDEPDKKSSKSSKKSDKEGEEEEPEADEEGSIEGEEEGEDKGEESKSKGKKDDKEETEKEKAVESWINFHYGKLETTAPISLFGKLQDFAMEALLSTEETTYGDIPYDALTKLTYMAPIKFIHTDPSLETAVESLLSVEERQSIAMEAEIQEITPETFDKSMIISTIVYTILETLKTLNLYSPSQNQVRATVHAPSTYVNSQNQELEIAKDQLTAKVDGIKNTIKRSNTKTGLMAAAESLDYCRYAIEQLSNKFDEFQPVAEKLTPQLDQYEKELNKRLNSKVVATESMMKMDDDRKSIVVREFDKINRFFNKPNIDRIEIHYNSTATESYIPDVIVRDNFGNIVDRSFLDFSTPDNYGLGMENVLRMAYPLSKLSNSNKMVQLVDHGRSFHTENLV